MNLLSEEDLVIFFSRVDIDVVFGFCRVRVERFNDEGVKSIGGFFNGYGFVSFFFDLSVSFFLVFVEVKEISFFMLFDKLIGFVDEFGGEDLVGEILFGFDGWRELFGGRIFLKKN